MIAHAAATIAGLAIASREARVPGVKRAPIANREAKALALTASARPAARAVRPATPAGSEVGATAMTGLAAMNRGAIAPMPARVARVGAKALAAGLARV